MEGDSELVERVKERITEVSKALQQGCGRVRCFAEHCCSNPCNRSVPRHHANINGKFPL